MIPPAQGFFLRHSFPNSWEYNDRLVNCHHIISLKCPGLFNSCPCSFRHETKSEQNWALTRSDNSVGPVASLPPMAAFSPWQGEFRAGQTIDADGDSGKIRRIAKLAI
jgi:hypothetical protein